MDLFTHLEQFLQSSRCLSKYFTDCHYKTFSFVTLLVLRLDNAPGPYDVSFGNSNYYNPTANDSSSPAGQENAHDGIPMDDIPPLHTSV